MQAFKKRSFHYFFTALLIGLGLTLPVPQPAAAGIIPSTITVTNSAIENTDGNGCSLYEALQASFNGAPYHQCSAGDGMNLIVFGGSAAGATITMPPPPSSLDLPMINKNVTITGPVTISGGSPQNDLHIFRIAPSGTLNLVNLTLKDAHTSGGGAAILDLNRGTINALGVAFVNNIADGDGGAINSNGVVNIVGSTFMGNKAKGVNGVANNSATGYGGAIYVDGSETLKLALTNFSGNLADKGGGAVYYSAKSADLSDTIFSGNLVNGTGSNESAPRGGGALYADSDTTVTILRSAFNGNLTPTSNGGALYSAINATTVISQTAFNGNIAASAGNSGQGGALYNAGGTLDISQALFLNNAVALGDGGAIANDRHGNLSIENSTFTANAALLGNGGAINNTTTQMGGPASSFTARNVTFSANAAVNSSGHGGAIFNAPGHSATLGNSIVDTSVGDNCTGTISSLGHNLDSAGTCGFNQAGDLSGQSAKLDAPAFNGGPLTALLSQKLLAGSPAIDVGDPAICAAVPVGNIDQRGDPRPKDGDGQAGAVCDIGALENDPLLAGYGSTPVQPGSIDFGSAVIGGSADALLTIFETGNTTLQVSNPHISGPNANDFALAVNIPFPLSIADGGAAKQVSLYCAPSGAGLRTATLTFTTNDLAHPQVSYTLTCTGTTVPKPAFGSAPAAPGPIDLGTTIVFTAIDATFVISSTGDADLHPALANPALGGSNPADFQVLNVVPATLAPGQRHTVQVRCLPSALGIRTATLTFTSDDPAHPATSFNLACKGEPAPPPLLAKPGQSINNSPAKGLDGAYGVAISPDGNNVYVTGNLSNAVSVFSRDPASGTLTSIQNFTNAALNGLNGARLVTVSPDGKNVYVASSAANALVTMYRDTSTGMLSQGGTFQSGLSGAYGVVVSPDGRFIYVSSTTAGTVSIFSRSSSTGLPNFVTSVNDAGLAGAHGLALSPDGLSLYVTAYSSPDANTGALVVYKRNPADGTLSHVQTRNECDLLACLFGSGFLDGLGGAYQVAVSPDGLFVYVVGTYDGAVVVFKRNGLDGSVARVRTYKDNAGGIDGLDGVSGVALSPNSKYLFATGFNDKSIAAFTRDTETGLLSFSQLVQRNPLVGGPALPLLDGARDIGVSPDGTSVYAAAFIDDAVVGLHTANPIPALLSLAPGSAPAGGAAFTLAVQGADFVPGAVIYWGATALTTTFVNNTKLTAGISADKIAAAGSINIKVVNPAPGGGTSNQEKFTITAPGDNPLPSITTITPGSAPAGGVAFTLTVNGTNFIAGSKVRWNGTDRTTTFVSAGQLTAQISAADIAAGGPVGVSVFNPGPGGGLSNTAEFNVAAPGENPTPTIAGISPSQTLVDVATADQLTLLITGANFIGDSQAQWNGANRPTSYVNATTLKMLVTAADLALGGQGSITVENPGPGGGLSNTATFTIYTIRSRLYIPVGRR
ncbi:MAG: beta-propeller fold lactonase family protein [Kouleothrix sp.]|nr:beta-propeller fold lactonase family protein [Kouleothrix sp.]